MYTETITLNAERNVTLTAYIQQTGGEFLSVTKRPAVLVLPGGGYEYCSDREADPVALVYANAGYHTFVLRYSVKEHATWPNPLDDYEQAMELIKSKAEEWTVCADKIAVIGFSAGGHLAAAAATMAKNKPAAAILGYAVCGNDVKACVANAPDTIAAVDCDTPPCFLFATRNDNVVAVQNTVDFMQALNATGVTYESHIYAYGRHGYATGDPTLQNMNPAIMCRRIPNWVDDSIGFLTDVLGAFGPDGCEAPVCNGHINDDHKEFLSIDCSIGLLLENEASNQVLMQLWEQLVAQNPAAEELTAGVNAGLLGGMKFSDALDFFQLPEEMRAQINGALNQIPNK